MAYKNGIRDLDEDYEEIESKFDSNTYFLFYD